MHSVARILTWNPANGALVTCDIRRNDSECVSVEWGGKPLDMTWDTGHCSSKTREVCMNIFGMAHAVNTYHVNKKQGKEYAVICILYV